MSKNKDWITDEPPAHSFDGNQGVFVLITNRDGVVVTASAGFVKDQWAKGNKRPWMRLPSPCEPPVPRRCIVRFNPEGKAVHCYSNGTLPLDERSLGPEYKELFMVEEQTASADQAAKIADLEAERQKLFKDLSNYDKMFDRQKETIKDLEAERDSLHKKLNSLHKDRSDFATLYDKATEHLDETRRKMRSLVIASKNLRSFIEGGERKKTSLHHSFHAAIEDADKSC